MGRCPLGLGFTPLQALKFRIERLNGRRGVSAQHDCNDWASHPRWVPALYASHQQGRKPGACGLSG
jgi:hypothetical protein